MTGRRKWLWLLTLTLGACGSPGASHQLQRTDGGEQPGDDDGGAIAERLDAPPSRDAAPHPDAPGMTTPGPDGSVLPDGPGAPDLPADTTTNTICGGDGQPCCNGSCTDDGNACNGAEVCMGGTCQHQDPVVCAPMDTCHSAGTCQPSTGTCTNPPKTGGTCNDNDACTQNDTCSNGVCKGTAMSCGSGLHCSSGNCVCDSSSCKSGKTCVNDACVSCGGSNQPCCGSTCNSGFMCSSGTCKTACSSKMGQACDTNTCQPGKYDCSGNCASKQPKNCGDPLKTCDPLNGQCVACGARYGLCCTDNSVEQCSGGPDDYCFPTSNGQKRCWITAHMNQRCGQNGHYCKYQENQCNGNDICVCSYGIDPATEPHCQTWDDGSGMPPTPP